MSANKELPLVVIVGPTASGKTSLAIDLAQRFNGEIICADSRTVYRGADIGTAKPSEYEQNMVVHHGLDLVEPNEYFSVYDFKDYANKKINEIRSRGRIPFLVGGTGLYIDSVIFDYQLGKGPDIDKRNKLNELTLEELYEYCKNNNIDLPENYKNKRYVVRTIERFGEKISKLDRVIPNTIVIGITTNRDELRNRISLRADQLFKTGVIDEAKSLGSKFGWDNEAMKGNLYRLIKLYELGEISYSEMQIKNLTLDWRLAKRQITWFKRNKEINWLSINDAKEFVANRLAN